MFTENNRHKKSHGTAPFNGILCKIDLLNSFGSYEDIEVNWCVWWNSNLVPALEEDLDNPNSCLTNTKSSPNLKGECLQNS